MRQKSSQTIGMRIPHRIGAYLIALVAAGLLSLAHVSPGAAQLPDTILPDKLAICYGFPGAVNGAAGDVNAAVATFSAYVVVIFGDTLQLPQYDANDPSRDNADYDGACTQNSPYFQHLQRFFQCDVAHVRAPVGFPHDQPILRETVQRRADGSPAHVQLLGQVHLNQPLVGQ